MKRAIAIIEAMIEELKDVENEETYTERYDRIDSLDEAINKIKKEMEKRHFKIFYKDGVFAMDINFTNKDDKFIKSYLQEVIDTEFNNNINSLYHIDFSDIVEIN